MPYFFETVTKKVFKGRAVDVIYADFSKPFDKIGCSNGTQGELNNWLHNWLDGRKHRGSGRFFFRLNACD